jgi:hypothetical protein
LDRGAGVGFAAEACGRRGGGFGDFLHVKPWQASFVEVSVRFT